MTVRHAAQCGVIGLLALLTGCKAADLDRKPTSLLMISIDTLRPDALGWIGGTGAA